jgi:hypothetical protein
MKRTLFILLVCVVALATYAVIAMRPMLMKVTFVTGVGYTYRYKEYRRWQVVPFREWGIGPSTLIGCGPNGGVTENRLELGHFAFVAGRDVQYWSTSQKPKTQSVNPKRLSVGSNGKRRE